MQRYTVIGSVVLCGRWYWNFSKLFEKTGFQHHFGCPNRNLRVVEQPSETENRSAACPQFFSLRCPLPAFQEDVFYRLLSLVAVAFDQGGNPTLRLQFAGGCAMGDGQNLLFV